MKPRQKVVTVEDITSSLYFLHVEQPEDAELVAPPQFQEPDYQQGPTTANGLPVPAVQRKALPGSQPTRKPVSSTLAPVDSFANRQNMYASDDSRRPGLLAPGVDRRQSHESYLYSRENQPTTQLMNRSPERSLPTGTSLILIRRDPSSGAQWNVARIEDPSMAEISSFAPSSHNPKRRVGSPIYIDVTNPGYSKFIQSDNVGRPSMTTNPSDVSTTTRYQDAQEPPSQSRAAEYPTVFRRRLWMEGAQYGNTGFGHRKNSSYNATSGRPDSRDSYDGRNERTSVDSRPGPPPSYLTPDGRTYSTIQASDRQTSFRGYVFTSPWNGRCEFITGGGGGSLKVRYHLTNFQIS